MSSLEYGEPGAGSTIGSERVPVILNFISLLDPVPKRLLPLEDPDDAPPKSDGDEKIDLRIDPLYVVKEEQSFFDLARRSVQKPFTSIGLHGTQNSELAPLPATPARRH